jgi:hypothetical protein
MKLSFDFADTFNASVRAERIVPIDLAKMPDNALAAIFAYGLQRIINDSAGSAGKVDAVDGDKRRYADEAAWLDACETLGCKKRDALYAGNVGRAPSEAKDPVGAEMDKIAREIVRTAIKTKYSMSLKKFADEYGENTFDEKVTEFVKANGAKLRDMAEQAIAERKGRVAGFDLNV